MPPSLLAPARRRVALARRAGGALRVLCVLCALGALGALSACVSKPTMKLNHADVTGLRLSFPPRASILLTVVLDVYNPNAYDVAVRAVRGQLTMADRYTLPVDFRPGGDGVWMPSDATTQVRVPVEIPVDLAIQLVREAFRAPSIGYRFTGRADVTATRTFQLEKDDYAVDEQGSVARSQLEQALGGIF